MQKTSLVWLLTLALAGCSASQPAQPSTTPQAEVSTPPATARSAAALPTATLTPTTALAPSSTALPAPTPPAIEPLFSYPIRTAGRAPGDGFFIRHSYASENTWYNPGYWHTGEDWYALSGDTAGAQVAAIAAGTVVYSGANYPGRVVILQHADGLYSMYGHLDPALSAAPGQQLAQGALIGTVLRRGDDVPNHLHFELRSFLTTELVNGDAPRYAFRCGRGCPPGPGYWPIAAPELPDGLGWLNPTHAIGRRLLPAGASSIAIVPTRPISPSVTLWSAPPGAAEPQALGMLELRPGARFPLLQVQAGPDRPAATSALAYRLWYSIRLPDGREGWVQAAVPTPFEQGSDGRAASVRFNLLPAGAAPE